MRTTKTEAGKEFFQPFEEGRRTRLDLEVRSEQVRLLYSPSLTSAIATIFVVVFMTYLHWDVVNRTILLTWATVASLMILARVIAYFAYFRLNPGIEETAKWERISVATAVVASVAWGSAGVFLFPSGDFARQMATLIILIGVASGGVTTLSALRTPVMVFLPSTMLPVTFHLLQHKTEVSIPVGIMCLMYTVFLGNNANHTYKTHLQNITLRLKSRNEEKAIRKSEETVRQTAEILKLIAAGEPAEGIFNAIARLYESRHTGVRCFILRLEGGRLRCDGTPSLPAEFCRAVDRLNYSPQVDSGGASIFAGQRVLIEDIAIDPEWSALREEALPLGLHACWSEPVKDTEGKVLGAFGMYPNRPGLPDDEELHDLEAAARLTAIVMARERRESLLVKLSNSLDQSSEAVVIADVRGQIEYVNPAFTKMTGYAPEEAIGQNFSFYNGGKQRVEASSLLWEALSSGEVWSRKIQARRKDGQAYPAHLTVSPVKGLKGEVVNFIGIQTDLSHLQQLEEQLQQAQKMEAIGTLVGGIAHDFNNALAGITGNLRLAIKAAGDAPKVVGKLELADKLAFRTAETIQQLLSFTRKGIVQKKPIPLNVFLGEALKLHRVSIPENIQLIIEIPEDQMVIEGDVSQLQQVLMNLLNNSRDALARTVNPEIAISLQRLPAGHPELKQQPGTSAAEYALIGIRDNGCGIEKEHLSHIFEPFFTTKGVRQGTGLGLSMAYGAVNSHDGQIDVSSAGPGMGTWVRIYLPLVEEEVVVHSEESGTEIVCGEGETILLADDDELVLEVGKALLEELNYRVLTARNGEEAVSLYRDRQAEIDLLMLDVVMPKMGGLEALKILRDEHPAVKVLFCTGYDKLGVVAEGVDQEAVITKPFSINRLSHKLKALLYG